MVPTKEGGVSINKRFTLAEMLGAFGAFAACVKEI